MDEDNIRTTNDDSGLNGNTEACSQEVNLPNPIVDYTLTQGNQISNFDGMGKYTDGEVGDGMGKYTDGEVGDGVGKYTDREVGVGMGKYTDREVGDGMGKYTVREVGDGMEKYTDREVGDGMEKYTEREVMDHSDISGSSDDKIDTQDAEGEPSKDLDMDENNMEMLTTDEEDEDFLTHVLRDEMDEGEITCTDRPTEKVDSLYNIQNGKTLSNLRNSHETIKGNNNMHKESNEQNEINVSTSGFNYTYEMNCHVDSCEKRLNKDACVDKVTESLSIASRESYYACDSGTLEYFNMSADSTGDRLMIDESYEKNNSYVMDMPYVKASGDNVECDPKGSDTLSDVDIDNNYIYTLNSSQTLNTSQTMPSEESDRILETTKNTIPGIKGTNTAGLPLLDSNTGTNSPFKPIPDSNTMSTPDSNTLPSNKLERNSQQSARVTAVSVSNEDLNIVSGSKVSTTLLSDYGESLLNGDKSLSKFDWSKYFNPGESDNKTPDPEMEHISPDLFCMTQLSPDSIYGKDHLVGYQRLYSRQAAHTTRSGSTLNTPDPVFLDDMDSNHSSYTGFVQSFSENHFRDERNTDVNNNVDSSNHPHGTKRKFADTHTDNASNQDMLSDPNITSIFNQGRPPDISTWTAVSSSSFYQSTLMRDYHNDQQANKPTCAVPPVQNTQSYSNTGFGNNFYSGFNSQNFGYQQSMPQSRFGTHEVFSNTSYTPQQHFRQMNSDIYRPSQFSPNIFGNTSNYGSFSNKGNFTPQAYNPTQAYNPAQAYNPTQAYNPAHAYNTSQTYNFTQAYNPGIRSSATYRLDFSSPLNVEAQGILNFVSNPSYLSANVTRPRPVHASNFTNTANTNFNNFGYSHNPAFSASVNRACYDTGIRSFQPMQQSHTYQQQQQPFRDTFSNSFFQTPMMLRPTFPTATQTFAESQKMAYDQSNRVDFISSNNSKVSNNTDTNNNEINQGLNSGNVCRDELDECEECEQKFQEESTNDVSTSISDSPKQNNNSTCSSSVIAEDSDDNFDAETNHVNVHINSSVQLYKEDGTEAENKEKACEQISRDAVPSAVSSTANFIPSDKNINQITNINQMQDTLATSNLSSDATQTINHALDISSTVDHPRNTSSTINLPWDSSSTFNLSRDTSSTINLTPDPFSTVNHPRDISSNINLLRDTSSTINLTREPSTTINHPRDSSSTINHPRDILSNFNLLRDTSSTINLSQDTSSSIYHPRDNSSAINDSSKGSIEANSSKTINHSSDTTAASSHSQVASLPINSTDAPTANVKQPTTKNKTIQSNEADSTTIDLTGESTEEEQSLNGSLPADEKETMEQVISPNPAHSKPKVQNKYFREIYVKKSKVDTVLSASSAVDLSKTKEKPEAHRTLKPAATFGSLPCAEPGIPVAAFLNSLQGPTLAYSGTNLVPYMNSIFAAMANLNKLRATLGNTVNPSPNACGEQSTANAANNQAENLALMQKELISNIFKQNVATTNGTQSVGANRTPYNAVSTSTSQLMYANPRMNVTSLPIPLYATPLQYQVRPIAPLQTMATNTQQLLNPFLYRLNIGMPFQATAATLPSHAAASVDINNNQVQNSNACNFAPTTRPDVISDSCKTTKKAKNGTGPKKRGRKPQIQKATSSPVLLSGLTASNAGIIPRMAGHDSMHMSIQGSNITAPTYANRGLTTYQPVPDRQMLYKAPNETRKASLKPRHFPFTTLQIGTYKYTCEMYCLDKVARVKLLFCRKVMVYEFQLDGVGQLSRPSKEMVEIEVPFKHIVSLWLYDKDMRVEVKEIPKVSHGRKVSQRKTKYTFCNTTLYNRDAMYDVTLGQLTSCPYHYIQFKTSCANRIKNELRRFDSRFDTMLNLPLIEDPSKRLRPGPSQITSHLLDPSICLPEEDCNNNRDLPAVGAVYRPAEGDEELAVVSCSCTQGCSSASCKCCVRGTTCTEGLCDCTKCRNPLNILHQLGLPADMARTDPCLMENIYQIRRLDCYVKTQLVLECCLVPVLLFNCIPGEMKCLNHQCNARYKYSWCTARLCNEDLEPRNHCAECGRCTDFRNAHCQKCNICYFAGESRTLKCPICQHKGRGIKKSSSSTDSTEC